MIECIGGMDVGWLVLLSTSLALVPVIGGTDGTGGQVPQLPSTLLYPVSVKQGTEW